ncbi:hypothetical protein EON80_28275, partial [bacterium]
GGGSGNSCPPPPPHVPNPLIYSYAFNAISEDDVFWSHSPDLGAHRHGFNSSPTDVNCSVPLSNRAISSLAVELPESTIWLADGEAGDGGLTQPEIFTDDHLDYASTDERRVSRRHNGQFNALFADGHVKWIAASKPSLWTVQND